MGPLGTSIWAGCSLCSRCELDRGPRTRTPGTSTPDAPWPGPRTPPSFAPTASTSATVPAGARRPVTTGARDGHRLAAHGASTHAGVELHGICLAAMTKVPDHRDQRWQLGDWRGRRYTGDVLVQL